MMGDTLKKFAGGDYPPPPAASGDEAKRLCDDAATLVTGEREADYGDKHTSCLAIARLWNAYLENLETTLLTSRDVAQMMSLLKVARTQGGRYKRDNYLDQVGWAAIAGELAQREVR